MARRNEKRDRALYVTMPHDGQFEVVYDATCTPQATPYRHARALAKRLQIPLRYVEADHMSEGVFTTVIMLPPGSSRTIEELYDEARQVVNPLWEGMASVHAMTVELQGEPLYTLIRVILQKGRAQEPAETTELSWILDWHRSGIGNGYMLLTAITERSEIRRLAIDTAATFGLLVLKQEVTIQCSTPLVAGRF